LPNLTDIPVRSRDMLCRISEEKYPHENSYNHPQWVCPRRGQDC
jgi:hypothetical protein